MDKKLEDETQYDAWAVYNAIRCQIEHENGLFESRLQWMLAWQTILLGAYGFLVKDNSSGVVTYMTFLIPLMGIYVALCSFKALDLTHRSITNLSNSWDEFAHDKGLQNFPIHPHGGTALTIKGGALKNNTSNAKTASSRGPYFVVKQRALPWVFVLVWLVVFVSTFH